MEKRLVIAIVLSILVLVLWQAFLVKDPKPVPASPAGTQVAAPGPAPVETTAPVPAEKIAAPPAETRPADLQAVTAEAEQRGAVETSLYRTEWSNKGGVLTSWKLREHKNAAKQDLELVPEAAAKTGRFPFALWAEDAAFAEAANAGIFKASYPASEPRRRGEGRGPVRVRRRPGPEGREDLRPDGRDLRGRDHGPRLA